MSNIEQLFNAMLQYYINRDTIEQKKQSILQQITNFKHILNTPNTDTNKKEEAKKYLRDWWNGRQ